MKLVEYAADTTIQPPKIRLHSKLTYKETSKKETHKRNK